jgi:hypothetical protein
MVIAQLFQTGENTGRFQDGQTILGAIQCALTWMSLSSLPPREGLFIHFRFPFNSQIHYGIIVVDIFVAEVPGASASDPSLAPVVEGHRCLRMALIRLQDAYDQILILGIHMP